VIPVEVNSAPWHYTTFPEALDHWQTLIAGGVALLAALIAFFGAEFFARRKARREIQALRALLASEIRLYVNFLIKTRFILTLRIEAFRAGEEELRDFRDLAVLQPPVVYPAAADRLGLVRRPRASDVVDFLRDHRTGEFGREGDEQRADQKGLALALFGLHPRDRGSLPNRGAAAFQVSLRRTRRRSQSGDREMGRQPPAGRLMRT
jgi:hypothetical protein